MVYLVIKVPQLNRIQMYSQENLAQRGSYPVAQCAYHVAKSLNTWVVYKGLRRSNIVNRKLV